MRAFLIVWLGQLVSLVGSGLTSFSLGVYIFQRTASTTQYALVTFCAAVPPLIVLPLAGPLIDRCDRRRLLLVCEAVGALATAGVGALAWMGTLSMAFACLIVAITASAGALQWPTWSATMTLLVPRDQLGRANGLTQLAQALTQVLAPALAGVLITLIGLAGVATIDFATFIFSIATLLVVAIPRVDAREAGADGYWRDLPFGWRYVFSHAGLAALLVMFAAVNFFTELAAVLFTPLVLSFATPAALGSILAVGGLGMVAGSAVMSMWGGPKRSALGAAAFAGLSGLAVASAGFTASVPLLAAAVAAFFFCLPLMMGSSQVTWQRVVPHQLQGRVFATRATVALSTAPLSSLLAGPLADRLFEPAMSGGGWLVTALGPLVGVGRGRGIALVLVACGALSLLSAALAASCGALRRLDDVPVARGAPAPATARS